MASDTWTVSHLCSVVVCYQHMLSVEDTTIYLVGGISHELEMGCRQRPVQTGDMLRVQLYNVATSRWAWLEENMSKVGLNLTCTLHNDDIYININTPSWCVISLHSTESLVVHETSYQQGAARLLFSGVRHIFPPLLDKDSLPRTQGASSDTSTHVEALTDVRMCVASGKG